MTIRADLHFDTGVEAIVELPAVPRQDDEILWTDYARDPNDPRPDGRTCQRTRTYRITKVQWAISASAPDAPCITVYLETVTDVPS